MTLLISSTSLLVTTDADCNWALDGEAQGQLKAGETKKVPLSPGEHLVRVVSIDGLDNWKTSVTVGQSGQKFLEIPLSGVRQARQEKEQREAAERKREEERKQEEARKQEQARKEADARKQGLTASADAQDITSKSGVVQALNLLWQRAESSTHATINGDDLVVHSERCSQERLSQLTQDQSALRLWSRAGFTRLVYTNDRDLTFTRALPPAESTDAERQLYAKNYEAQLVAKQPGLWKVTVEGKRLVLHTPLATKANFYKADWTTAKRVWMALRFTEFLYTNDKEVAILVPTAATQ